jgi:uncharacterized membrane protein YoaK (UPF0700 family)
MTAGNADKSEPQKIGRFEFWLRFICGAILGVFVSVRLFFILFDQPVLLLVIAGVLILACGFGAAKYGDRFWRALFDR